MWYATYAMHHHTRLGIPHRGNEQPFLRGHRRQPGAADAMTKIKPSPYLITVIIVMRRAPSTPRLAARSDRARLNEGLAGPLSPPHRPWLTLAWFATTLLAVPLQTGVEPIILPNLETACSLSQIQHEQEGECDSRGEYTTISYGLCSYRRQRTPPTRERVCLGSSAHCCHTLSIISQTLKCLVMILSTQHPETREFPVRSYIIPPLWCSLLAVTATRMR